MRLKSLAVPFENLSSGICGQQRPRSACAFAQSDQGLHCSLTESLNIRGMFEMNCLFLSGDFKFQVSPKILISCPRSTPRSGPDLIANLSDGLKIMNPDFITCDDIGKLLFVIFWKHLKQLFGHFNPLPLLLVSQQMWHPSSRNL